MQLKILCWIINNSFSNQPTPIAFNSQSLKMHQNRGCNWIWANKCSANVGSIENCLLYKSFSPSQMRHDSFIFMRDSFIYLSFVTHLVHTFDSIFCIFFFFVLLIISLWVTNYIYLSDVRMWISDRWIDKRRKK